MARINQNSPFDERRKNRGGGWKYLVLPLIAILGLVGYSFYDPEATERTVWLVNGTSASYDVLIDGESQTVAYGMPQKIKLLPGTHTLRLIQPVSNLDVSDEVLANRKALFEEHVLAGAEVTFTLSQIGARSAFKNEVNALNPDGAAILRFSDVVYGDKVGGPDELRAPALHHIFDGVDDVFVDSPNSVETRFYSGGKVRRRVDPWLYEQRLLIPGVAGEPLNEAETKAIIMARFSMEPDSFFWETEAKKTFGETDASVLVGVRSDVPSASVIPARPTVSIPALPVESVVASPPTATPALAWTPELDAAMSDDLLTLAIGTDVSARNGGPNVKPLISAIEPLKGNNETAQSIVYLLQDLVSYTAERGEALSEQGVPDRVHFALLLILQRRASGAKFTEYNDAARRFSQRLGEPVPASWRTALGDAPTRE